jgi:hypothetical protein
MPIIELESAYLPYNKAGNEICSGPLYAGLAFAGRVIKNR